MQTLVTLRALQEGDLALLDDWLASEFVRASFKAVEVPGVALHERYLAAIRGLSSLKCSIICVDGCGIGFIQSFPFFEFGNSAAFGFAHPERVWGFDMFLARSDLTGRGIGSRSLRKYLRNFIFGEFDGEACIANPDPANIAAIRAYEKIGFKPAFSSEYPNARILWRQDLEVQQG